MLTFQKLTKENYQDVLNIKHHLFPESNSDDDYVYYFDGKVKSNYYLVLKDEAPCATIGWYEFDEENAFVGWFGVVPDCQGQGMGGQALSFIIEEVKPLGYSYLRVYTDKVVNAVSLKLYDKFFELKEDYTYPDKIGATNNFVIYTKSFNGIEDKWNNRPLGEDDNYEL